MKKFWILLLSLALIAAFSMPASAAPTVTLKGNFTVTGIYKDNHSIVDEETYGTAYSTRTTGASMGFYAQRLRLDPTIKIADGLTITSQMDIMTRVWGQNNVNAGTYGNSAGTRNTADEQNIHFRQARINFTTKYGNFWAGYGYDVMWGTEFLDSWDSTGASFGWTYMAGPWLFLFVDEKIIEGRLSTGNVDSDLDKYCWSVYYLQKAWQTGLIYCLLPNAAAKPYGYDGMINVVMGYFRGTFGGFFVEAEVDYGWGKDKEYPEHSILDDVEYAGWAWYLKGRYTMGPAYVGFQYGHIDGDDPKTTKERESYANSGNAWQPTLILWSDWTNRFAGNMGNPLTGATMNNIINNVDLYQIFAGFKPTPKWNIHASYTIANADEKPYGFVSDEYGKEFDLTVSYKIFDNLEYMVGFGYLWAGDYFKGPYKDAPVDNDYLVMHQLTLSF